MVDPSRRELILQEVKARLEAITAGDEFATDAGAAVHIGETPIYGDESDPQEVIAVIVGDDEPTWQGEGCQIDLPLSIEAQVRFSKLGLDEAYRQAERIAADIKRAMELSDRLLITSDYPRGLLNWNGLVRGATRVLKPEPSSVFVGVAVNYTLPYRENWGTP